MRLVTWTALLLGACAPETVEIAFTADFDGVPFACGTTYEGVGLGETTIDPLDLRLYLFDVAVVDDAGEPLGLELEENDNQHDGVVLLDFEDGTEACETGSTSTYTAIRGALEGAGRPAGLRFTVGVPEALNHLDYATQPAPLDQPGMFWSWAGGYRYVRLDVASAASPLFALHLGATDCTGSPGAGFSCAAGHTAQVALDGWTPDAEVRMDLASVYAGVDIDAPLTEGDSISGCMSFPGDPDCVSMFAALGLPFLDGAAPAGQTLFSVVQP